MKLTNTFLAILIVSGCVVGCERENVNIPEPDNVISLKVVKDSIAADNYSYAEIVATVDNHISDGNRKIKFTTTSGNFSNNGSELVIDLTGSAHAFIKDDRTETVTVSANIDDKYVREVNVHFTTAYPNRINIEPESVVFQNGLDKHQKVTAKLIRNNGSVSDNIPVHFFAEDTAGNNKGAFFDVTLSNANNATANFWILDSTYTGFLYLKASVYIPDTVRGTSLIYVTH